MDLPGVESWITHLNRAGRLQKDISRTLWRATKKTSSQNDSVGGVMMRQLLRALGVRAATRRSRNKEDWHHLPLPTSSSTGRPNSIRERLGEVVAQQQKQGASPIRHARKLSHGWENFLSTYPSPASVINLCRCQRENRHLHKSW